MASPKTQIRSKFPRLVPTQFKVTSEQDQCYNCVAYAAGENERFWWPVDQPPYFWPLGLPFEVTLENFVVAFATLGYAPCESFSAEAGIEKVAIYVDDLGIPTHMARQLDDGSWTSKLGCSWDIAHKTLAGLSGVELSVETTAS